MKIAYFDCFSGISGDMCLGALVDAGVRIETLSAALKKLPVRQYHLEAKKVSRSGIAATKVAVIVSKRYKPEPLRWKDMQAIINNAKLKEKIRLQGLRLFRELFEAEAKVHGKRLQNVHLHELGGVDCMVDIFGTLIGLDLLGVEKLYTSPINVGNGTVKSEHGVLPVPAPATTELLKGYPIYASGIPFELTTPTGAAILAGLRAEAVNLPLLRNERIGYGAGNENFDHTPNVLRVCIGDKESGAATRLSDMEVLVMETNIDDMNPQLYEDVIEKLFEAGALDVFLEPIIMKKGRPAVKLTVIAEANDRERLSALIFDETTTLGMRFHYAGRLVLDREIRKIKTAFGELRVKIARKDGIIINIAPEYADLKALSRKTGHSIKKLSQIVMANLTRLTCGA